MSLQMTLFTSPFYVELPQGWLGWMAWLGFLVFLVFLNWKSRSYHGQWKKREWGIFLILALSVPVTSLFLILRFPPTGALPFPGKPVDPTGPALAFFAALPWVMAARLLGPGPAAVLAGLSGIMFAVWDTHSPFTPLEFALLGTILGVFLRQRYRTLAYRFLRNPLSATLVLAMTYPALMVVTTLFYAPGSFADRLDYGLNQARFTALAAAAELLIAGVFALVIERMLPETWKDNRALIPSPSERKLESRFLFSIAPAAFILLLFLLVGDWTVANNAAREMVREQMSTTARVASETIPFFIEAGQNLVQQLSKDDHLYNGTQAEVREILMQDLRSVPFFRQLYYLDETGDEVTGYPHGNYKETVPPEELVGVGLALKGVPIQSYTIPPREEETAAQISFLSTVVDERGNIRGVLVARADLASNPFTQPVLAEIRGMVDTDGEGMILDQDGRILYHQNKIQLMEKYTGRVGEETLFYDGTAPDGTRRLVYYQPVLGHPWSVVLAVPARRAQQLAIDIAAQLLGMVLLLFLLAFGVLRFGLKGITDSLRSLSQEANRLASGELDHALQVEGDDEVSQLRHAFEKMRLSLKMRMEEMNRLLVVSQGVAASLEMEDAALPVLDAALSTGASSARIVLANPTSEPDGTSTQNRFGAGALNEIYSALDEQILRLVQQHDRVVLTNPTRVRLLSFPAGFRRPQAILALALRHESQFYGALWVAFEDVHRFTEEEVRFLVMIAGQAALAAANAQLFKSAEIGRQRLAAILASTPDPVLVTDHRHRLLLSNPAAWQALDLRSSPPEGQPIEKVVAHQELIKLLRSSSDEKQSAEVILSEDKIYLAIASSVMAEGKRMGRVCLLRDITYFKELDALKSEFVATVSHDLRSPLTLMRGYATMMEMVGDLNEQQEGYVRKIVTAIESMSRLVNNLLDLGRIEAGVDLQLEMIPVHDIVERVAGALQLQANQKRLQLVVEIPSGTIPLIEADQALLQQALQNLLENAIKYTDPGGKVSIMVQTRPVGLVFEVRDTGIGIAPVDQARLFEKFYRVTQRETKKQPGTGLGLAIVKSIAERHGGKVWMESQLGKGSVFYLLIPLRQPRMEAASIPQ